MARPRKFTPAQTARFKAQHAAGATTAELARKAGVTWTTMAHTLLSDRARKAWLRNNREYMRGYRRQLAKAKRAGLAKRRK